MRCCRALVKYERFGSQAGPRPTWKYEKPAKVLAAGVAMYFGVVYASSFETVPFTQRSHSVLLSAASERSMGEQTFAQVMQVLLFRLLHDPLSKRTTRMACGSCLRTRTH